MPNAYFSWYLVVFESHKRLCGDGNPCGGVD